MKARFFFALKWLSLAALLCLLYGFLVEPRLLKVRDITIISPNYAGEPIRIGFMTDIHIGGRHVPAGRVDKLTARLMSYKPDIVIMTGDFVSGHTLQAERSAKFNAEITAGISNLAALDAPHGVYANIGNHDAWYDAGLVEEYLKNAGVTVLDNAVKNLDDRLCILGFADSFTSQEKPIVYDDCTAEVPVIAMMHSPDSFKYLRPDTALALAGHTHGGQINIPLIGRRVTATDAGKRYAYGKVDANGVPAFVSAGIGTSILPARFRAPPEIVIITLHGED